MPLPRTKTEKIIIQDSLCQMNECFKVKTSVDETFHMVMSLRSYPLCLHTLIFVVSRNRCFHFFIIGHTQVCFAVEN